MLAECVGWQAGRGRRMLPGIPAYMEYIRARIFSFGSRATFGGLVLGVG